jgi:hypothetical protein
LKWTRRRGGKGFIRTRERLERAGFVGDGWIKEGGPPNVGGGGVGPKAEAWRLERWLTMTMTGKTVVSGAATRAKVTRRFRFRVGARNSGSPWPATDT